MIKLNITDFNAMVGDKKTARRYFQAKGYYLFKKNCKADTSEYWISAYKKEISLFKSNEMTS